jgi:hypothetical protein
VALFSVPQIPGIRRGVYLVSCDTMPGVYKIGITANINDRLRTIRSHYPAHRFQLVHFIHRDPPNGLEKAIHCYFSCRAIGHEWFYLTERDVLMFKTLPPEQFLSHFQRTWNTQRGSTPTNGGAS